MKKTPTKIIDDEGLPKTTIRGDKKVLYSDTFDPSYDAVVGRNDVLTYLDQIPDETATLVVSSPPYNIGKPYEKRVEFKQYLAWQKTVLERCVDILKPNGSLCWEVGNYVDNGEIFPLDVYFYNILKDMNLKLRNRIIWHFEHGLHASKRFSGRYETILWFTKTDDYIFNLDPLRIPQKYPGKRSYKGADKGKPTCNPDGKNPSDLWNLAEEWDMGIWDIPNVKANHIEKTIHPAQFPIELIERLVLGLTNEGDIVLDPFCGVGSSIIAALIHNRKGIGVDREKEYTDIAYSRILDALDGKLKKRELGKPVHVPTGKEKVAQIPSEWSDDQAKKGSLSKWL